MIDHALITGRIKQSLRTLKVGEIRGELLKRSRRFISEAKKAGGTFRFEDEWQDFRRRWRISEDWSGDLETLAENTHVLPSIHLSIPHARLSKKQPDLKSFTIYPAIGNPWHSVGEALHDGIGREDGYLLVRIHPWTLKKDLELIWTEVQVAQKKVFGQLLTDREKRTFARDLCWYDLHKRSDFGRLSYQAIQRRWKEHFPNQAPPSRATIQKGCERIAEEIRGMARPTA